MALIIASKQICYYQFLTAFSPWNPGWSFGGWGGSTFKSSWKDIHSTWPLLANFTALSWSKFDLVWNIKSKYKEIENYVSKLVISLCFALIILCRSLSVILHLILEQTLLILILVGYYNGIWIWSEDLRNSLPFKRGKMFYQT